MLVKLRSDNNTFDGGVGDFRHGSASGDLERFCSLLTERDQSLQNSGCCKDKGLLLIVRIAWDSFQIRACFGQYTFFKARHFTFLMLRANLPEAGESCVELPRASLHLLHFPASELLKRKRDAIFLSIDEA